MQPDEFLFLIANGIDRDKALEIYVRPANFSNKIDKESRTFEVEEDLNYSHKPDEVLEIAAS